MTAIDGLKSYAKKIAKALDDKDNQQGKIDSNSWNAIFNVKEKKGKEINSYITLKNAEKSILAYLRRCESDINKQQDLAEKWLKDLEEKADAELAKVNTEANNETVVNAESIEQVYVPPIAEITQNATSAPNEVIESDLTPSNLAEQEANQTDDNITKEELSEIIDSQEFLTEEQIAIIGKTVGNNISKVLREILVTPAQAESEENKNVTLGQIAKNDSVAKIQSNKRYDEIIEKKATKYNIDPLLIKCIIYQESRFNPNAKSPVGARGLMQLMPGTAKRQGVKNVYNPEQNIEGGTKYLSTLMQMFDDVELALAAYNAGEGNVIKYGYKIPPYKETRNYVRSIMSNYNEIKNSMSLCQNNLQSENAIYAATP